MIIFESTLYINMPLFILGLRYRILVAVREATKKVQFFSGPAPPPPPKKKVPMATKLEGCKGLVAGQLKKDSFCGFPKWDFFYLRAGVRIWIRSDPGVSVSSESGCGFQNIVLIFNINSEHVLHAWRKIDLFSKIKSLYNCFRSHQLP